MAVSTEFNRETAKDGKEKCCCGRAAQQEQGSTMESVQGNLPIRKLGTAKQVFQKGVSTFAMLTGTLPFTVEPFNIKQLHQKMLIGEISPIPSDISPGAVHFMQSLLEPDPAKRPGVKEAIKDKWLNEGFTRKILNAATCENSELNPVVLNYMTEIMEFSLSEVTNILINNRPSPAMASYCLLLKKLIRYQKDHKRDQRENEAEKHNINPDKRLNKESEIHISQKAEADTLENLRNYGSRAFPSVLTLAVPDAIQEDATAITLENQEKFPEVSKFAGRELVHLGSPKSSRRSTTCESMYQPYLDFEENLNDFEDLAEGGKSCHHGQSPYTPANDQHPSSNIQTMIRTRKVPSQALMEKRFVTRSPLLHQDTRFKDLQKAVDDNIYIPTRWHLDKEGTDLLMIDCPQLSPFPRLRQPAPRETLARKISWLGASQQHTNICPLFLVNGSKAPVFPMSQQQSFTIRSMRQPKENPSHFFNKKTKKSFIQLRHTPKTTDQNLPVLPPPYQTRLGKKTEILRLNFA
ncbi:uncharacterized protein LOC142055604 [Phalacrocorax aristotelis]|uniref:uncharacterized protein LOC142055604 n=1 Tax=Phalacrocorax aristotelis TaxID=126867 RepID=UPI003F4C77C8